MALACKRVEGDRGGRAGSLGIHGLRNGPGGRPADGDRRARRRGGRRPDRGGGRGWRHRDRRERHRRRPRGWARGQPPRPARPADGERGRATRARNGAIGKAGRVDQPRHRTFRRDHAGPHVRVQWPVLPRVPADRHDWRKARELLRHRLSSARRKLEDRRLVEPRDFAGKEVAMRLACGTLLLTAVLALSLGAIRVGAQTGTVPPDLRAAFKAADKNGDGRLDRDEFRQAAIEGFYFRDREHKGYLTADQLPEASPAAFKAANVKGDGRLSLQEQVNALMKDFEAADVNKDGTLTFEEFEAYVKRPSAQ